MGFSVSAVSQYPLIGFIEEEDNADELFFMSQVSCTGSEQKLSQCSFNNATGNCTRAAISCLQISGENIIMI